jgi:F420-dependent oxidoreductase-like protein
MATHPVRFGVQTGQQNVEWTTLLDLWRKADAWGYDSLWTFDHFYPIFTDPSGPCLENWTTLGALALATSKARIGQLVSGNTYRHPCVAAKSAVSVDHISGGRLNMGIGAGWFEPEHAAFGIDFKTVRERLEALDEACCIIKSMFTHERTTLHGKHYNVTDAFASPKPVQQGGIPIMIGGTGRKILLKLVAKHADMWNATGSPSKLRELIDVIAAHGDDVDRDTAEIEKTVMMPLCYTEDPDRQNMMCGLTAAMNETTPEQARDSIMIGGKQECLDKVAAYVEAGVTHFIFMTFAPYFVDEIQSFAEEVAPAARS